MPSDDELRRAAFVGLGYHSPNMESFWRLGLQPAARAFEQEASVLLIRSGRYVASCRTTMRRPSRRVAKSCAFRRKPCATRANGRSRSRARPVPDASRGASWRFSSRCMALKRPIAPEFDGAAWNFCGFCAENVARAETPTGRLVPRSVFALISNSPQGSRKCVHGIETCFGICIVDADECPASRDNARIRPLDVQHRTTHTPIEVKHEQR